MKTPTAEETARILVNWRTFYLYETELTESEKLIVDRLVRKFAGQKVKKEIEYDKTGFAG